jgi:beta-lactam-binding protein with PASTA domain
VTPTPTIQVPDVIGLDAAAAEQAMAGLNILIENQETCDAPAGTVIWQLPAPGAEVGPGEMAVIVVAREPEDGCPN